MLSLVYNDSKVNTKINQRLTPRISCNISLKQSDITSAIFIISINDLCMKLKQKCTNGIYYDIELHPNIPCLMYADDVANCAGTVVNLQKQLNVIDEFCNETNISVNLKNSEIVVFRNGGPQRGNQRWLYRGEIINVTSVYKYMGLLFTQKLSWSLAKKKLSFLA